MTVSEWLAYATARLGAQGFEAARMESQLLAAHILREDRSWLLAHSDHEFPHLAGEALLVRRENHEPLAYLIGEREFFGRRFVVDSRVLVPRHETEVVVDAALEHSDVPLRVLDLGTGSGCLGITLKLERQHWNLVLSDISSGAVEVSRLNADRLGAKVEVIQSDLFAALEGRFDMIVTNPPYIGRFEDLPREVVDFEPNGALFSGDTGDEFYERLALEASVFLSDAGRLITEIGYQQAERVPSLFARHGWQLRQTVCDLTQTERVLIFHPPHARG